MRFGSVCSGIEAASVAWHPLGWRADWFAEIEKFPAAVLANHYPQTPNLGDMTQIARQVLRGAASAPDVLVGGTPCQAFSVAGMRAGLNDPRGALTIKFVELADAIDHVRVARGDDPAIIVWENVPGVLSDRGNAFGCFLGALAGEDCELQPSGGRWTDAGCVYGPARAIAWRVLDAQYFGLAQRRRRVFVVASARAGFDPLEVLFEREGVRRDTPPSREAWQGLAAGTLCSTDGGSDLDHAKAGHLQPVAFANAGHFGGLVEVAASDPLRAKGGDTGNGGESLILCMAHGQGGAEIAVNRTPTLTFNHEAPIVVHGSQDPCISSDTTFALGCNNGAENAVLAFSCKDYGADAGELSPTLRAMGHGDSHANAGGQVAVCITGEITHTLKAEGFDASEDGTGRGQPIVAFSCKDYGGDAVPISPTLRSMGHDGSHANAGGQVAVARAEPLGRTWLNLSMPVPICLC